MDKLTKSDQLRVFAEGIDGYLAATQERSSDPENITVLQTKINHVCANPTLKLVAIEKADERKLNLATAEVYTDENRNTEEQKLAIDTLKRHKYLGSNQRLTEAKLLEEEKRMNALVEDIKAARAIPVLNEPRDETRCTELHKQNVALANILTLLTATAGQHLSHGRKQKIRELVENVHAKNYAETASDEED